jgi:hypothetical protein
MVPAARVTALQWPYYAEIVCDVPILRAIIGGVTVGQTLGIVIDVARYLARSG